MGVLTGLYQVDEQLFKVLQEQKLLKSLTDVINGYESPEILDLPADHKFTNCYLDKAWDDFESLLKGIDKVFIFRDFQRRSHDISSGSFYVFYWLPEDIIACLSDIWTAVKNHIPGIQGQQITPDITIVKREDLDKAFEVFAELIQQRLDKEEEWFDYSFFPYTQSSADYVFSYFRKTVEFMTLAVCNGEEKVIVGISG